MPGPINSITPMNPELLRAAGGSAGIQPTTGENSFQKLLLNSLEQVNEMQETATDAVGTRLTGGDITSAEVYTSVKKADLALRMMLQIRNKIVQAYNEIQNMRM